MIVLCIIFVKVAGKQCNLKTISQMGGQTEILPHVKCIINVIFLEVRSWMILQTPDIHIVYWVLVCIATFCCADLDSWEPQIDIYQKVSSHGQILPEGIYKDQIKVNVVKRLYSSPCWRISVLTPSAIEFEIVFHLHWFPATFTKPLAEGG